MKSSTLERFKDSLLGPQPSVVAKHVLESLFTYQLDVTPKEIWPYVSDTSRMNKELGFSPRTEKELNGETHVSTTTLGKDEEWIEKPWIWVDEKELLNHRIFLKGWMNEHVGVFKVTPIKEGCEVQVYFKWSFSSIFKKLLFQVISKALEKKFAEFFQKKAELIKMLRSEGPQKEFSPLEPASPYEAFLNYLKTADELDLDRVQIKKVSKIINLPVDLLMDVSSEMIKDGMLSLSWDVICPHCRAAKSENKNLSYLEDTSYCETCDVEFNIGSEESVEVIFHPTEKVRKVQKITYCAAEPSKKKHIKLFQPIFKDETKSFNLQLMPGYYRIRKKGSDSFFSLRVDENSKNNEISWDGIEKGEGVSGPNLNLILKNISEAEEFYTFEEAWWQNDRLAPGEVLSHHKLRKIFSEDHLKVGVKLNVGDQVIMFTDIVGSTPFYRELGDVMALKAVKEHYNEVQAIIESHQGIVVKFIGDAVMAAFLDLHNAMAATLEIQKKFHPERSDTPVRLRASLHHGPILCANVNVGIDYFGNTVNQSAKIQKWADAFEIAMAESDWNELKSKYSNLKVKAPIYDEKLEIEVRVVSTF